MSSYSQASTHIVVGSVRLDPLDRDLSLLYTMSHTFSRLEHKLVMPLMLARLALVASVLVTGCPLFFFRWSGPGPSQTGLRTPDLFGPGMICLVMTISQVARFFILVKGKNECGALSGEPMASRPYSSRDGLRGSGANASIAVDVYSS